MNATEFLKAVSETIAAIGHRDNQDFIAAAAVAGDAIRSRTDATVARQCWDYMVEGIEKFTPESKWYSHEARLQYIILISRYVPVNTVAPEKRNLPDERRSRVNRYLHINGDRRHLVPEVIYMEVWPMLDGYGKLTWLQMRANGLTADPSHIRDSSDQAIKAVDNRLRHYFGGNYGL